jgi:hypothetical protein
VIPPRAHADWPFPARVAMIAVGLAAGCRAGDSWQQDAAATPVPDLFSYESAFRCEQLGRAFDRIKGRCTAPSLEFCELRGWSLDKQAQACAGKEPCRAGGQTYDSVRKRCGDPSAGDCRKRGQHLDAARRRCAPVASPSRQSCQTAGLSYAEKSQDCVAPSCVPAHPNCTPDPYAPDSPVQKRIDQFYAWENWVEVDVDMDAQEWEDLQKETPAGELCSFDLEGIERYPWRPTHKVTVSTALDGVRRSGEFKQARVRKKSWCWSFDTKRPSLRIDLVDDGKKGAAAADSLVGVRTIVLNNSKQDLSFIRQCLTYQILRDAGLAAPRCNFASLRVNGVNKGVYVNVEAIKKPLFGRVPGSSSGEVYEISGTDVPEELLAPKGKAPPAAGYHLAQVTRSMDVQTYLKFWAAEAVLLNWDGYSYGLNNTFIFKDARDHRLSFIAWGADQALQGDWLGSREAFTNSFVSRTLSESPVHLADFCDHVTTILKLADPATRNPRINDLEDAISKHFVPVTVDPFPGQEELDDCEHGRCLTKRQHSKQVTLLKNVLGDLRSHVEDTLLGPICHRNVSPPPPVQDEPLRVKEAEGFLEAGVDATAQRIPGGWELSFDRTGDGTRYLRRGSRRRNAAMFYLWLGPQRGTRIRSVSFDLHLSSPSHHIRARSEQQVWVSAAVRLGPSRERWVESRQQRLYDGPNSVSIDFFRHSWKDRNSLWQYGLAIPDVKRIDELIIKLVSKDPHNQNLIGDALLTKLRIRREATTAPAGVPAVVPRASPRRAPPSRRGRTAFSATPSARGR